MIRPISIKAVLNGYIVNVGCQEVVYQSKDSMLADLHDYLTNPQQFEGQFLSRACNRAYVFPSDLSGAVNQLETPYDQQRRLEQAIVTKCVNGLRDADGPRR